MTADYIYTHDYTYDYLVCYFLPEIYDPFFRQDYAAEIEEDERLAYSRYIAALLPYEKDYDQIVQKLYDKEDAIHAAAPPINLFDLLYHILHFADCAKRKSV